MALTASCAAAGRAPLGEAPPATPAPELFLPGGAGRLRNDAGDEGPEIETAAAIRDERELVPRRRPPRPAVESLRAGQLDSALAGLPDVPDPDLVVGLALEIVDHFLAVLEVAQLALVGDVGDPLA